MLTYTAPPTNKNAKPYPARGQPGGLISAGRGGASLWANATELIASAERKIDFKNAFILTV